jgi:pyruvate dehydrogenase E1 component beta subunit
MERQISYSQALNETFHDVLKRHKEVFMIGQGITSPWYVGTTTKGLIDRFGPQRVIDSPVSENAVTGIAAGAAMAGARPIVVHPRMDFMHYAMDQIVNHIAQWSFMFNGRVRVPVIMWAIINRAGEQAAQHSQALQGLFMHVPGLKIIAPSNAYDAKGLILSALAQEDPVVFMDDRWLYDEESGVPKEFYKVPIGKAKVSVKGDDITVVSNSYMSVLAKKACEILKANRIGCEVVDLRTIKPLDSAAVIRSVKKTGRLIILDGGYRTCGVASEVSAVVNERAFGSLKAPVKRITLPDKPAPASRYLEKYYYVRVGEIVKAASQVVKKGK